MSNATDESMKLTHVVAVIGYVYRDGKFLLLKRNNPHRRAGGSIKMKIQKMASSAKCGRKPGWM